MTTKLITEIKEMIFQLPKEEINQLIKEVAEIMATKDFMELAETGFSEWNHPEEDIYNEKTVLNKAMEEAKLSPLLDAEDALKYQEAKIPKAGLHLGAISMAEDFDQPLPDSFWLGEE